MTPHIEAKKGDYSDIVLLPGDPLRAKWIAETYLDEVKQVNSVRNMLGFTGYLNWNDSKRLVSVQGGGMGMASNAIYIHELYEYYAVKKIIRVGLRGLLMDHPYNQKWDGPRVKNWKEVYEIITNADTTH